MADGFGTIIDNSSKILEAFNKQVENGLKAIGSKAEGYAKGDCPVDTGRLRNSITFATSTYHSSGDEPAQSGDYQQKATPEKVSVYIGTNVEYAPIIEYKDMNHQTGKAHFLRDAATTHSDEYEKTMEAALKK